MRFCRLFVEYAVLPSLPWVVCFLSFFLLAPLPGIFFPAKKRMTEVCPHVVNPHRLVEIHREPSCRGTCLIVVDQINRKTYVSQRPQEMLKRLSEQADPNDPQASVSFGGFKKAIHKPVLYKGRYQIRLHSLSDSITVLKKSEKSPPGPNRDHAGRSTCTRNP